MKLTGGQIVAKALKEYGVQYVAGVPGHGCWSMLDAFLEPGTELPFIQVMHEQSAVHMADGYYRASGKPMAAVVSIGAGATNTIIGLATAFADSTATMLITGGPATHMAGHGVMQELDRNQSNDFPRVVEGVTKRHWEATRVDELPFLMHRAFNTMLSGRPGPVHLEIPMDLQAESADVSIHPLNERMGGGRMRADPQVIEKAVALLVGAKRPVIVAGGGAITSEASEELVALAEKIGAAVVTTWNGKGAIPEDHRLNTWSVGQTGTTCGNAIAASADVVLSVGCRFTDWSASSYRKGASFSFPPAKLIHIDIDFQEIGKNYPTEVGVVADAKSALTDILAAISAEESTRILSQRESYFSDIERLKGEWEALLARRRDSDAVPFTSQRPLGELRKLMDRDGIVVVGSGNTQGAVKQTFPVYLPRTHLTSGSFSSMGWAVPAAIGAKLAMPTRQVVCIVGDGDFLQSLQEMAVCVMHNIPVVFLVQNNSGYMSIRGGQRKIMGRHIGSEFNTPDGKPYSPNFTEIARNFGLEAWRVEQVSQLNPALKNALACNGPSLVEVITARDAGGPFTPGWWDFPVPAYVEGSAHDEYNEGRALEQHL
ncbi:thiamine pyrophosphate-binding protein [Glaciimonas sp. PCH181]|uniref:thiamine pyrophosphate-binding protein n=1 Tax=Glaciimonas sp. PCH181 TaxID=2133943 RepID=UPI001CEC5AF6|nr:thiamine pyrophosphate-binding protein [Glaciimonas sp. PCH181]